MPRCAHTYADNSQCKNIAHDGKTYCYQHDPAREEERKANARKGGKRGGRGRPLQELHALRMENKNLRERMLKGELEPRLVAVCVQSVNTDCRLIEATLRAKEAEEFESRLSALEEALAANNAARQRGA
jgi:hypothetical protein